MPTGTRQATQPCPLFPLLRSGLSRPRFSPELSECDGIRVLCFHGFILLSAKQECQEEFGGSIGCRQERRGLYRNSNAGQPSESVGVQIQCSGLDPSTARWSIKGKPTEESYPPDSSTGPGQKTAVSKTRALILHQSSRARGKRKLFSIDSCFANYAAVGVTSRLHSLTEL